ncbi:MAG: DnaD domain protein [Clostridia bacterium]|nr:DnaD domain protein [Clostridia bacterium]
MQKNGFILYVEQKEIFDMLTDEEAGKLIKNIYSYEATGKELELEKSLKIAFQPIKQVLDKNREKYVEKCKQNKANIEKRWNKNTSVYERKILYTNYTDKDNDNDKDNNIKNNNSISDGCVDGLEKIFEFYKSNIGQITPYIEKLLRKFSENLNQDILLYALEISVEANQRNFRYIKAILNNWSKANIRTLEEAKKESKKKNSTAQGKSLERKYNENEFKKLYAND